MSKESSNQNMNAERKTEIQVQKPGCTMPLNGCMLTIALISLLGILSNEYKRSGIRLEEEKIKLEHLKQDGTIVNDTLPVVIPDTLKIGKYTKTYIPLLKQYQTQQQKGR
jgi:hypothetical protein